LNIKFDGAEICLGIDNDILGMGITFNFEEFTSQKDRKMWNRIERQDA